jgi:hypothetical protein
LASSITGLNVPDDRSASDDVAAGRRSRDFGCMTTSGRRGRRDACRRSRWKYCAGVDG